jgi:hypothetical protein
MSDILASRIRTRDILLAFYLRRLRTGAADPFPVPRDFNTYGIVFSDKPILPVSFFPLSSRESQVNFDEFNYYYQL